MVTNVVELRKHPRVAAESRATPKDIPANHAAVVNVSHGGACLLLREAPPRDPGLALKFQCDGEDHILRSRLVWSKRYARSGDRGNRAASGWLAGVAFARGEDDTLLSDNPLDILRAQHVTVYPHAFEYTSDPIVRAGSAEQHEARGAIALAEQAVVSARAAANELAPIFAKHFSGIRMVLTRDRHERDATFRTPEHAAPADHPQADHRAKPAAPVESAPACSPAGVKSEPSTPSITPNGARTLVGSGLGLMAASLIAAAILAATLLWPPHKDGDVPAAVGTAVERPTQPRWANGVERSVVADWIAVQKKFRLSDTQCSQRYSCCGKMRNMLPGRAFTISRAIRCKSPVRWHWLPPRRAARLPN